MRYKGMTFDKVKDGYKVSSDNGKYTEVVARFSDATSWIWNMADNHDISKEFCHRICQKFKCDVYGNKENLAN